MVANMQLTINSFWQFSLTIFFPDISLTFSKIPDISLTAVKFPDISRFSRKVVTVGRAHTYASHVKKLEATKQSAMKSHKPQCHRCVHNRL